MMEVLTQLREGTCKNCNSKIILYIGDLSAKPVWYHSPEAGGALWCPGSKLAEPEDD